MKKKATIIFLILILSMFIIPLNVEAFEREVTDFNRIWYDTTTNNFNKNGDGALVLATTYTNNTLRTIDYCQIDFNQNPFYFGITFSDKLERDDEGNIIEPEDGYFYLRKAVVINYFPDDLKRLASKNLNYKTIEYNGNTWFRLYIPSFNNKYEWGTYEDPEIDKKWYTWGNDNSIKFRERAMFIKKIMESVDGLKFDISHSTDNSGQQIAFSKNYLADKGINNPVFELQDKYHYERISYQENSTHYLVSFPHFSEIGIHEAKDGWACDGYINSDGETSSELLISGYYNSYNSSKESWTFSSNMVDGDVNDDAKASTSISSQFLDGFTISEPSFSNNISAVNIRYHYTIPGGEYEAIYTKFRPIFDNGNTGSWYGHIVQGESTQEEWSSWYNMAEDANSPSASSWTWDNISNMTIEVNGDSSSSQGYVKVSKVDIEVIYDRTYFCVNRSINLTTEQIKNCNETGEIKAYNPTRSYSNSVVLSYPVSSTTNVITEVRNNTCGSVASEVESIPELINNTYYFDSSNHFVYIRTINLTSSTKINWTINCSSGTTFSINIPPYLDLGELCFIHGKIKDGSGNDIDGVSVETRVLQSGVDQITPVEWNCTGGNVQASFYTTTLNPGIYDISMEFEKGGLTYKYAESLYLATTPPSGTYIPATLHFSYYNDNTGLGISQEKFKLFVSEDTSIDSSDRIYRDYYEETYTGQTLYYRVDDYFNNQIYPTTGDYETLTVSDITQWEDIPINWYSFSVKNMNHSIVYFKMTNESRTYDQYLFPYEPFYWNVLNGTYTINLTYYNTATDAIEGYSEETITITDDSYYWIRGYDLQDIIIEVTAVNTSIDTLSIDISAGVDLTNSAVNNISLRMTTNLTAVESNITNLNNQIWNSINITDSIVDYINNTIWNDISAIDVVVDYINNTIWSDIAIINSSLNSLNSTMISNFTFVNSTVSNIKHSVLTLWNAQNYSFQNLENRSTVLFNFYNTNEGLGLDRETLKVYVNGSRLIGNKYYTYNESDEINVTVKDYYNNTLYHNNFTITAPYTFIDLGLTFHSWLFSDKNDDYYMISILKYGASRWWERGIVPYGEREFMIPSGNYTLRIYDKDDSEIYNSSSSGNITVNNSRVYVIHGTNLSLLISGQSVIKGQLLELSSEIEYALMPDEIIYSSNPPRIFSVFNRIGQMLGNNVWKVCPALDVIGTTRNSTMTNSTTSHPLIADNSTTGVEVTVINDILYLSGNSSVNWVNITYADNGTLMQNTTYIPNKININGEDLTITSSSDINILRETTFSKMTKFYWNIYNSTTNLGHISNRAGFHNAVLEVKNSLNVPLYDVYVFAGFSDKTIPDFNSVRIRDIENGVTLERGENYKTTGDGVEFMIENGLSADSERAFQVGYYKDVAHTYVYEDAQIEALSFVDQKVLNDEFYKYSEIMWVNNNDKTFRGSLRVKLGFDVDIDRDTVNVYDIDNNQLIDDSHIIVGDEFVWISGNAIGSVSSGSGRSFGIYFQELEYPGSSPAEWHLDTPIFYMAGMPFTPFFIIFLISILPIAIGIWLMVYNKKYRDSYGLMVIVPVVFDVILWIMQSKGI